MVVQALQMKANLENVVEFRIPYEEHEWTVDLEQPTGNVVKEKVLLCKKDTVDLPGSKGIANLLLASMRDDNDMPANITILDDNDARIHDGDADGTYTDENNDEWATVCVVEARGCEVGKWHLTGGYKVTSAGEERKIWDNANCNPDQEFCDVDDAEGEDQKPVCITNLETRVITYHPKHKK